MGTLRAHTGIIGLTCRSIEWELGKSPAQSPFNESAVARYTASVCHIALCSDWRPTVTLLLPLHYPIATLL